MKLRLEKETVRMRLSPDEIRKLKSEKAIVEKISVSKENGFSYSIQIVDHDETCCMDFKDNSLEISIPNALANKWMNSNQVAIKETIDTDNGDTIVLVIEVDLPPRKNKEKK